MSKAKKKKRKGNKKANKKKMVITKEQQRKMDAKIRRDAQIEASHNNVATHKVHKSVKDYTRKPKHKKKIDPND